MPPTGAVIAGDGGSLETRPLGQTGQLVSVLGLGGAPLANPSLCPDEQDGIAVAQHALARGITFIDSAPLYGRGESERRIGLALRSAPAGQGCLVATKVGYVPEPFDYSAAATIASVRASRERLGLDRLPLVQLHELNTENYEQAMGPTGALAGLRQLKAEGVIDQIGVTGSDLAALARAVQTGAFATLLIWRHLHLLDTSGLAVVRAAAAHGLGIIVGTPYAGSILATGNRPGATYLYEPASDAIRARVAGIDALCAEAGVSLRAVALQWLLRLPGITTVIAGAEMPAQIDDAVAAVSTSIPDHLWRELASLQSAISTV